MASTPATPQPSPGWHGHRVVRAAFVLAAFGWGVGVYGPPVYLHAVVTRTGWPLQLVAAAVSLHFLSGVLVITRLPALHRRFGVPATLLAGAAVTAAGLVGWALAERPWQLFAAAAVSGMGWVTMGAVAVNAVVSPWHQRSRPVALARAYNGASIGGVLFPPLWVALIGALGFAGAAAAMGLALVLLMAVLGQRVLRHTPHSLGQAADGAAADLAPSAVPLPGRPPLPGRALWRDARFRTLAAGMALGLFAQIGLLAHLFTLLVPTFGAQRAALVMGAATALAIVGRSVGARALGQGGDRRRVAALAYGVQLLGSVVLLLADAGQPGLILLGVALFGSGIGNATSLPPLIAQTEFAPDDVPRVVALVVAMAQGGYAFAPAVFGLLLAAAGAGALSGVGPSSALFFGATALVQLGAALVLLAGRERG